MTSTLLAKKRTPSTSVVRTQLARTAQSVAMPAGRLPWFIQASLRVGPVDDPLEREADRVANEVTQGGSARTLQRTCACEGSGQPCPECAESSNAAPQAAVDALTYSGRPIDRGVREAFEPRFGTSFENVRIHDDAQAASGADSVGARAYTVGNHIVFAAGEYQPHNSSGRRTLAHELTHVVQQD